MYLAIFLAPLLSILLWAKSNCEMVLLSIRFWTKILVRSSSIKLPGKLKWVNEVVVRRHFEKF